MRGGWRVEAPAQHGFVDLRRADEAGARKSIGTGVFSMTITCSWSVASRAERPIVISPSFAAWRRAWTRAAAPA